MIIKSRHAGYTADGVRRVFMGGGGSSGTQTSYTTNIPEYAQKPFMDLVGKSQALSEAAYKPYTGERIAGFNPMQQQSFQAAQGMQVAPQVGMGTGLAAMGALGSYTAPGMSQAYMSPYMQSVVDVQQREAVRQNQIANQAQQAKAVGAGAFGGSREALMRAESARNLGTQLGDIQARGLQSAYETGLNQFNAEQNRMLQGAQALSGLGQQQYTQQMGITGLQNQFGTQQQQQEQARLSQGYADYQAAQEYPYKQLGFLSDILRGTQGTTRTMYEPTASPLQSLVGAGTAMYGASKLFAEGGDVDYTQGGVFQGQGQGQDPRLGSPLNFARGGKVSSGRGIEALVHDMQYLPPNLLEQKARAAQSNDLKGYLAAKIAEQEQQKIRAGAQAQQALNAPPPQGTVVQQDLANSGIAAAAPQSAGQFADGGIVSFAGGEEVPPPKTSGQRMWRSFENYMQEQNPFGPSGIATAIGDTLSGWKGGPEAATQADEEAPSIYASPEEWAAYRARQPQIAQQRAENANELQRMRNRVATQAVERKAAPAPAVPAPQGQPGRTVSTPLADAAQATLRKADAVASKPTGSAPGTGAKTTAAPLAGLGAINPMAIERERFKDVRADLESARDAQRNLAERNLADYDADMAKLGTLGAEREARLKGREKELEGRKEEIKGNALMQAGLAILSADPKRGLAAAIGTGGQAGLAAFEKDAEKLQAAKEKIQDSLDNITDLRRQEQIATGKERRGLKSEIDKAQVDFAKSVAEASGARYKVTSEMGAKLYDSMLDYTAKMAEVSAYRDAAAMRGAGTSGVAADKQQLAELKALGLSYQEQLKTARTREDRAALQAQLRAVNNKIAEMSGLPVRAAEGQTVYDFAKIGK